MADEESEDAPAVVEAQRKFKRFWFHVGDAKFTHLDLTGTEALALEKRTGVDWGELRPSVLQQRMAVLETFLARTDPEGAAAQIGAMTIGQLEDAVTMEWEDSEDDLPDHYADGLPKAAGAP